MQIVVDGLMTHYQRQGKGKVVILLHGWADRLETFRNIMPELAKQYDVIALDLPGFGQTQMPTTTWKLDHYALFLQAFIKKLGLEDIYALVGHSNGGALAIKATADGFVKPQKLVLLASSGVRDTAKLKRVATKAVAKTGKVMTFWLPKTTKQKLQKKLYGTIGSDMLVAPHLQETFKQTVRQDIQRDAVKITVPTLLIYGEQDKATPIESVAKQLNTRIAGSYLKIIPGADHFVHQVAATEVSQEIQEFLA